MMKWLINHRRWVWLLALATTGIAVGRWMPFNPSDPPIPVEPPRESNRVHHPEGFSIVLPSNWRVTVLGPGDPSPGIIGMPRTRLPTRTLVGFFVQKLGEKEPDRPEGFHPVEFQGEPARSRQAVEQVSYKHSPQFVHELVFRRNGCWYRIRYYHPGQIDSLPEMVRQYLLTFRAHESSPEEKIGRTRDEHHGLDKP